MRLFIFTPLLILGLNSYAMECAPSVMKTDGIENLLQGIQENKRDWWAASEIEVLNGHCRKDYPSFAEQESYLKKLSQGAPLESKTINGAELEDSPAMLALFRDLTTYKSYIDEVPEELKNLNKTYQLGSDCKKVECALGKIYGEKRAKEMLYMKQKFGLNTSPITRSNMQEFSDAELKNIQKAVMDLPPHLLPLEENKQCTRLHKDYSLGLGTLANATITFANNWNEFPAAIQQSTVLHELSHNIGSAKKLDDSKEWLELSGWVKKDDNWEFGKDNFVSDYAASNPAEDFAETIVSFRFSPEKLQKVSPEKYKFIKEKVFGGVEYLKPEMCLDSKLMIAQTVSKIAPSLESFSVQSLNPVMKDNLLSYCNLDSLNFLLNRSYKPFEECLEGAIGLELAKQQIIKDNPQMSVKDIEDNLFSQVKGRSAKEAFGIKFSDEKKKEIGKFAQTLMDEYELDAYKESVVYVDHNDKESYCKDFVGVYTPSRFKKMKASMKDKFTLHDNEVEISKMISEKCLKLQSTFPKYRPFEETDLKKLLR